MRKIDKLSNILNANFLFEQRYISKKNTINEDFDFDSYIDSQEGDGLKNSLRRALKIYREEDISDFNIKRHIDDDIAYDKNYREDEEKEKNKKTELNNFVTSSVLLGKKIVGTVDAGVELEDGTTIYVDEYNNGSRIILDSDNDYIIQYCSSSYDYESAEDNYKEDTSSVIFPNKKEAKLFLNIVKKTYNTPKKVKLQYIFTPDDVNKKQSYELPSENSFDYLKDREINLSNGEYKINNVYTSVYSYGKTHSINITINIEPKKLNSLYDDIYSFTYVLELDKFTNRKKITTSLIKSMLVSNSEKYDYSNILSDLVNSFSNEINSKIFK